MAAGLAKRAMILPNTILAGAQKSGTTALCRFIDAHPHCRVSEPKEPNVFSRAANLSRLDAYGYCFRSATPEHRILVDGTTTYMADPAIAQRIRQVLGAEAKIIFVLRAPVARTYSGFLHMLKRGHERRAADEIFLDLPDNPIAAAASEHASVLEAAARGRVIGGPYRRLYDDVLWNYRYVGNSLYSTLVESYSSVFRRENILILLFEELIRDVASVRTQIGAFLDVDPNLFPQTIEMGNQTRCIDIAGLARGAGAADQGQQLHAGATGRDEGIADQALPTRRGKARAHLQIGNRPLVDVCRLRPSRARLVTRSLTANDAKEPQ